MTARHTQTIDQRMGIVEHDLRAHASTITAYNDEFRDMKSFLSELNIQRAVRVETDRNMSERLSRIEKSIDLLTVAVDKKFAPWTATVKWLILTSLGILLVALMKFILSGALTTP